MVKPGIPLVLLCALLVWAASALTFYTTWAIDAVTCLVVIVFALVAAVLSACMGWIIKKPIVGVALSFVCIGIALGGVASKNVLDGYAAAEAHVSIQELVVQQDSSKSDFGYTTHCSAKDVTGKTYSVRCFTKESYLAGEVLACNVLLQPLQDQAKQRFRTQGISAQVRADQVNKQEVEGLLGLVLAARKQCIYTISTYAGDSAPLYNALLCGYRQDIANTQTYEAFKAAGLAHVVAVSGAHLAIVLMLLIWALRAVRTPKKIMITLSVLFVCAYVIFAGAPLSALRSALMVILSLGSFFVHRRSASLAAIGVCVLLFIVTNPATCLSVSLFLSAGSTLGIVLFSSLFSSWVPRVSRKVKQLVVDPLSLTVASNVITLPFSAALFSQISLIAPLANIVVAPLFALACTMGLLGCILCLIVPAFSQTIMSVASVPVSLLSSTVNMLSSIPFASIACSLNVPAMLISSVVLVALLWFFWPKPKRKTLIIASVVCVLLTITFFVVQALPRGNSISALDVGQGDAILITSGTSKVMVDTGNTPSKLRSALGKLGIYKLDAVVITHPDDDHCASLETLGSYVQVDTVFVANDVLTCPCKKCSRLLNLAKTGVPGAQVQGLSVNDRVQVGDFSLNVVWPSKFSDEGGNADSICMMAELDVNNDKNPDWRCLLTGDAESEQLEEMIALNRLQDIDVLKVGHHGSKVSLSKETLQYIHPEIALISSGVGNRYGHPSKEVLDLLNSIDCQTERTDSSGTITIEFYSDTMKVKHLS